MLDIYDFSSAEIKPLNSEGRKYFNDILSLDEYDLIYVYGLRLRNWSNGNDNWLMLLKDTLNSSFSSSVRSQSYKDYVRGSANYKVLIKLIKLGLANKLVCVPSPLPIERKGCVDFNIKNVEHFYEIMGQEINELGVRFMNTPRELQADNGVFSKIDYKNSKDRDFNHLNEFGGSVVLKSFMNN